MSYWRHILVPLEGQRRLRHLSRKPQHQTFTPLKRKQVLMVRKLALFVWLISHQPEYFSLRTNQLSTTSQQYFSLRTNQHQPKTEISVRTRALGFGSICLYYVVHSIDEAALGLDT
jgi:hypothetical protein